MLNSKRDAIPCREKFGGSKVFTNFKIVQTSDNGSGIPSEVFNEDIK